MGNPEVEEHQQYELNSSPGHDHGVTLDQSKRAYYVKTMETGQRITASLT